MTTRRTRHALPAVATSLAVLATTGVHGTSAPAIPTISSDDFCVWVQHEIAGTAMVPDENVVYVDYEAFKKSKTAVRPLTTHQFVTKSADDGTPRRVSCKVKTPDHLNAEYGAGTATDRGLGCSDLNRSVTRAVFDGLDDEERMRVRVPPGRIVFDADETTFMGSSWITDYPFVRFEADTLHVQAKVLRVDWDNIWLAWAPDRLRGAYYCHLIAPEYLRQLVLGETVPDAG